MTERFPDEEIFRFGTEQFDEVFEDRLIICPSNKNEIFTFEKYSLYKILAKYFSPAMNIKISCKPGCIKIERVEK